MNFAAFGRVHMLYLDVKVNGVKVKALVDSGAQATIMSPSCAELCNIMRLVDKRFSGLAHGVGTANIIGRVHSTMLQVGSKYLSASFTVMEGKHVDLLLGLDILKGHQAIIDLARNKLIIQGEEVDFLGEAEIPRETEAAVTQEPTVAGPGGTQIGARSGAVTAPTTQPSSAPAPSTAASVSASQATPPMPARPATGAQPSVQHGRPAARAQGQAASFPEEHIQQLIDFGAPSVTREMAIQALTRADGNVEYAANYLFQNF
jgi:DNA damage-inducible protein 1